MTARKSERVRDRERFLLLYGTRNQSEKQIFHGFHSFHFLNGTKTCPRVSICVCECSLAGCLIIDVEFSREYTILLLPPISQTNPLQLRVDSLGKRKFSANRFEDTSATVNVMKAMAQTAIAAKRTSQHTRLPQWKKVATEKHFSCGV